MSETQNAGYKSRSRGDFIFAMGTDLKLILLLTAAILVIIYLRELNQTILVPVLGLAFLFFIPGYAFVSALYPKKDDIGDLERVALSFGLSICISPMIELVISLTPLGLRIDLLIICLVAFTLVCAVTASLRRCRLQKGDRFSIDFLKAGKEIKALVSADKSGLDRVLTALIIFSILLVGLVIAQAIIVPRHGENFTEFFVLGPNNTAGDYPESFVDGQSANVIVGIVNHEYRDVSYNLLVILNDSVNKSMLYGDTIEIADQQSWKKPLSLTPTHNGTGMNLEFLLYADGNMTAPYRECHFSVDVSNATRITPEGLSASPVSSF